MGLVAAKVALDRVITACIGLPCHCHLTTASYPFTDLPPEATKSHPLITSLNKHNASVSLDHCTHTVLNAGLQIQRSIAILLKLLRCSMSTYRASCSVTTPTLTNICVPHRVEQITHLYLLRRVAASTDAIFRESVYCNSLLNTSRQLFHNPRRVTRHLLTDRCKDVV